MGWPNASSRSLRQEVVRFNMVVQILDMEGLPPKYSTFQVVLQKGGKRISSGELLADEKHRMVPDTGGAATLLFVSSMQRATSGIDFEEKMYKLQLLRVNPRSVMHRLKKVAETQVNLAEACSRNTVELRLAMDLADSQSEMHDEPWERHLTNVRSAREETAKYS